MESFTMKHPLLTIILAALASTSIAEETREPEMAALVDQAKAAAKALGGALKAELEAALRTGGPIEALSICQMKAPAIASRVSAEHGMQVGRVSLKTRNPDNAPRPWQADVLHAFEARKAAGEDPASLSHAEVVDREFRFMQAIPTAGVCLNCHGASISPALKAKLNESYPGDQATGYREGDLRGAFVVVKQLAP
jgi:hypothetical protein